MKLMTPYKNDYYKCIILWSRDESNDLDEQIRNF